MTIRTNIYDVLVKPMLSEKSNRCREKFNQYVFQVAPAASKEDVKKAVEKVYNVKVETVRTVVTRGKVKSRGSHRYKAPNVKKAIVTLPAGAKLGLFEDL